MINGKQLKAISAFIKKDGSGSTGGLTINFDKSEIFAYNGSNAVLVELVGGLEGKGQTIVPLEVVLSAIVLIGDGNVTATREDFCGIPFEPPMVNDFLIKDYRSIFVPEDIRKPGRPGLYTSASVNLLEGLDKVFPGLSEFVLPTSPNKPLILEIGQSEKEIDDDETPTEIVKAAIMPRSDPPLKNTWDGLPQKSS